MKTSSLALQLVGLLSFGCVCSLGQDIAASYKRAKWGDIYINLHLYYDQSLVDFFHNDEAAVKDFIRANVNSAALSYNNHPFDELGRFRFVVHTVERVNEKVKMPINRDGNYYRVELNRHYRREITHNYAALVLFTYENWLYQSNKTEVQGLSNVGVACRPAADRAVIVQARSYRAAFILAHELGHSLGLEHDELMGCGRKFIMSASTGPGKSLFSRCSLNKLQEEFTSIFNEEKTTTNTYAKAKADCFRSPGNSTGAELFPSDGHASYSTVPLMQQCRIGLGDVFTFPESALTSNICSRLACTNGLIQIYSANPALENSTCGGGKYCRAGKCR